MECISDGTNVLAMEKCISDGTNILAMEQIH
jgi:hypothetical protein